jgi:uroporphyrinogen decarboxylase
MNSKERVYAALRRTPTDRIPIFMWFHPGTAAALAEYLRIDPSHLDDVMGNDIKQTWVGNNYAMEGIVHERDGDTHTDDWGITWVKEGPFNQVLQSPLAGKTDGEIADYQFPHEKIEALLGNMQRFLPAAEVHFLGCDVSPCQFELLCRIRGMEETIFDLAARPDLTNLLLEKAAAFEIELASRACDTFPLDWLWTGDDVAGQESLIMSPKAWRLMIRPHLERIVRVGTSRGLPVAHHCCGALRPIIPDLIDIGVTVLNPVQCTCPGMEAAGLKRDFGSHLTFMGGVDTQELLPKGTAREVHDETRRLIDIMTSDGGGYILAASHTIPPETPLENIFAMYGAAGVLRDEIMDRAAVARASGEQNAGQGQTASRMQKK